MGAHRVMRGIPDQSFPHSLFPKAGYAKNTSVPPPPGGSPLSQAPLLPFVKEILASYSSVISLESAAPGGKDPPALQRKAWLGSWKP